MSVSTFENIMYRAGYSRKKPARKPQLSAADIEARLQWALALNPDKDEPGDDKGFNFRSVWYTGKTPAGEQRGMQRSWQKDGERWEKDVKKDRVQKYSQLQFYSAFTYDHKGPCVIYERESSLEKTLNDAILSAENEERRERALSAQTRARGAFNLMNESDING